MLVIQMSHFSSLGAQFVPEAIYEILEKVKIDKLKAVRTMATQGNHDPCFDGGPGCGQIGSTGPSGWQGLQWYNIVGDSDNITMSGNQGRLQHEFGYSYMRDAFVLLLLRLEPLTSIKSRFFPSILLRVPCLSRFKNTLNAGNICESRVDLIIDSIYS